MSTLSFGFKYFVVFSGKLKKTQFETHIFQTGLKESTVSLEDFHSSNFELPKSLLWRVLCWLLLILTVSSIRLCRRWLDLAAWSDPDKHIRIFKIRVIRQAKVWVPLCHLQTISNCGKSRHKSHVSKQPNGWGSWVVAEHLGEKMVAIRGDLELKGLPHSAA